MLLYVGITNDPEKRDREHRSMAEWRCYAARREVTWYPDRRSALDAERSAIRDELPLFNRTGSRLLDSDEREEYLLQAWFREELARHAATAYAVVADETLDEIGAAMV